MPGRCPEAQCVCEGHSQAVCAVGRIAHIPMHAAGVIAAPAGSGRGGVARMAGFVLRATSCIFCASLAAPLSHALWRADRHPSPRGGWAVAWGRPPHVLLQRLRAGVCCGRLRRAGVSGLRWGRFCSEYFRWHTRRDCAVCLCSARPRRPAGIASPLLVQGKRCVRQDARHAAASGAREAGAGVCARS